MTTLLDQGRTAAACKRLVVYLMQELGGMVHFTTWLFVFYPYA